MKLNLGISITLPDKFIKLNDFSNLTSIQIMFSKSNLDIKDIKNIKKSIAKFKNIFVHASYQINMGSDFLIINNVLYNSSLDIFITEIKNAILIGAKGIVIHIGKNVKNKYDPLHVHNNMINFIIKLFDIIKNNNIFIKNKNFLILFETPAGQKGDLYIKLTEIINFIQIFNKEYFYKNIGLCIDTCHIFQAGYDINDNSVIKNIHNILFPFKNKIHLIHLNDSLHKVGMHIDKHQQIGKGEININNLIKFIVPYTDIPLILETKPPFDTQIKNIIENNNKLKS